MTQCKISLNSIKQVNEFVALASACKYEIDIVSGRYVVDAKSIMGIYSLDLTKQLDLNIHADPDEASDFIESINEFVVK